MEISDIQEPGAYPTWDSDGNKRNTYRFGVSYFPNEEFQLYSSSKRLKSKNASNGLKQFEFLQKSQRNLDFTMIPLRGNKHELRLKNQIIMIKAITLFLLKHKILERSLVLILNYNHLTYLKILYKLVQIKVCPLSYFYLVYTRADSFFTNDDLSNFDSLLESSWKNPGNEILTAKIRLKF